MQTERFTPQNAARAKTKNIIELSFDFSAMVRVFAKGSGTIILERLETFFAQLADVNSKAPYDALHAEFCEWFTKKRPHRRKELSERSKRCQLPVLLRPSGEGSQCRIESVRLLLLSTFFRGRSATDPDVTRCARHRYDARALFEESVCALWSGPG
jgi:hypothetical protein